MRDSGSSLAPSPALLRYVASLVTAVIDRDLLAIRALLGRAVSSHLPREVREEVVAQLKQPRSSLRAPIRLLEYQHRLKQLAATEHDAEPQLELPLRAPQSSARRRSTPVDIAASRPTRRRGDSK